MRLLVATDLSEASNKALMSAVNIAGKIKSEIILLHVFEVSDIDKSAKKLVGSGFLNREIKNQLEEITSDIQKKYNINSSYLTKEGELFETLAETAKETKSDIIFIGTHGVHGVQHITGSFLAKTINSVNIPVWVSKKNTVISEYKDIYILIDELFDNPVNDILLEIAEKFNSVLHYYFTESTSSFTSKELIIKIQTVIDNTKIKYTISSLNGEENINQKFVDKASLSSCSLMVLERNNNDISPLIDIFNNKNSIEVLCLN
ncbi:MAG: universal stress protein [Bacteroidia bacterium]|nr:universal stress protein [Bacteroidia bacterium]